MLIVLKHFSWLLYFLYQLSGQEGLHREKNLKNKNKRNKIKNIKPRGLQNSLDWNSKCLYCILGTESKWWLHGSMRKKQKDLFQSQHSRYKDNNYLVQKKCRGTHGAETEGMPKGNLPNRKTILWASSNPWHYYGYSAMLTQMSLDNYPLRGSTQQRTETDAEIQSQILNVLIELVWRSRRKEWRRWRR